MCPLAVLAAFVLACSATHASDSAPAPPGEHGFDNVRVAIPAQGVARARRMPLQVTISGGQEPLRGRVLVEVPCDETQECRSWTRFEHDGERGDTIVSLILDAGLTVRRHPGVRVRLIDDEGRTRFDARGRVIWDRRGGVHIDQFRRLTGPPTRHVSHRYYGSHSNTMVWYVVDPGAPRAEHPFASFETGSWAGGTGARTTAHISSEALPEVWAGYDGADVVAVMASEAHLATREAKEALDLWVQSGGRLLVFPDLADPSAHDWRHWLPSLAEASPAPTPTTGRRDGPLAGRVRELVNDEERSLPPFVELSLDDHAASHGWRLRWAATGDTAPRTGLIAEGPHGLGRVLIVGLRPSTWSRFERADGSSLLATHMADSLALSNVGADLDQYAVGMPESAGRGLLIGLLLMIVLLALLLGYADGFLVRKSKWPAAARWTPWVWIALFTLAALILPPFLRTGEHLMIRTAYTELIADPDPARGSEGWQQGITLINADGRMTLNFETDGDPTWWGGVSTGRFAYRQAEVINPDLLSIEQQPHPAGSGIPGPVPIRPMTVRLFSDESRVRTALGAELTGTPDEPGVRLTGLPEDAEIMHAAVRMPDGWHELDDALHAPDAADGARTLPWSGTQRLSPTWISPRHQPWVTTRRVRAMDARLATGGWAVLHIRVDGWPNDVRTEPALPSVHRSVVRVLVPFPEAWTDTQTGEDSQEEAR